MDRLEIELVAAPTAEARALVEALEAELAQHHAPEQRHGLALEALFAPNIRFFLARADGAAVGCGGIALLAGFAEVKRMFVRPTWRRRGVAQALLARLEAEAEAAGHTLLRLETGIHQPAAVRLYEAAGFAPCPAFGAYLSLPAAAIVTSRFFEKALRSAR